MCKKASDEVMTGQAEKGLHRGRGKKGHANRMSQGSF